MIFNYISKKKLVIFNILTLISCSESVILAYIVNSLITIAETKKIDRLPFFVSVVVFSVIVLLICNLILNKMKVQMIRNANMSLRRNALYGILSENDTESTEQLSFLTNDLKLLESNRFNSELSNLAAFYTLILSVIYSVSTNWILTIVFFFGSSIPMLISKVFQKKIENSSKNWSNKNSEYINKTKNVLSGAKEIYLYDKQLNAVNSTNTVIHNLENSLKKMNIVNLNSSSYISSIANVCTFLLPFSLGIYMVINGQATLGSLFAIVQISNAFVRPVLQLLKNRNNISTTNDIVKKLKHLCNIPQKTKTSISNFDKHLVIEGLNIHRGKDLIVSNIDLFIKKHEKIAIIGKSGSGKSTLLDYLINSDTVQGFAKKVELDSNSVDLKENQSLFSYSGQNPVIFSDTIWFNLTMGSHIGVDKVKEVCKSVGLSKLLSEKGFDYVIGYNVDNLSGGQLARIELARAILSQREIILLDEFNASLDNNNSKNIHNFLLNSNFTIIETIHHYDQSLLQRYDKVIDLSKDV
ncbi:ATP-binding cassette domain-containing protein [Holzapfeliella sp. JNUCC 80]